MSGGWGLSISAKSKQKDLALDVIKFMNNSDNILNLVKISNNLIVRKDTASKPEIAEMGVIKKASEFLDFTHFRPTNEDYPSVSTELQVAVEAVVTGTKTPEQAQEEYAKSIERILGKEKIISK